MAMARTSDLETEIDVIDNQHMRIVDYINRMEEAIRQFDKLSVGQVLDELADVPDVKGGIDRMAGGKQKGDWFSRSVAGFFGENR